MKKLCYFINSDWYFELHWLERAIKAKEQGYEVHIITEFCDQRIMNSFQMNGFYCHHIKINAQSYNPIHFLAAFFATRKIINKIKPDILHCVTIKPLLIGGVIARFYNVSVVLSFVGLGRVFMDGGVINKYVRIFILQIYKSILKNRNSILMFEHDDDRNKLTKLLKIDHDRTVIINGAGVDPDVFKYSCECTNKTPAVLFASRLLWSKGIGDLVEVKKRLMKKGVVFDLIVAGIITNNDSDSVPMSTIDTWKELGLITWLGHSNNVYQLIKESNLVALPSVYPEGIPRILLEACSVGRACIAYNVGGCSSLVKNNVNGVILDKNDIDGLCDKIEFLLNNPGERILMGLKGREYIKNKFSSEHISKNTLDVYQNLIAR